MRDPQHSPAARPYLTRMAWLGIGLIVVASVTGAAIGVGLGRWAAERDRAPAPLPPPSPLAQPLASRAPDASGVCFVAGQTYTEGFLFEQRDAHGSLVNVYRCGFNEATHRMAWLTVPLSPPGVPPAGDTLPPPPSPATASGEGGRLPASAVTPA